MIKAQRGPRSTIAPAAFTVQRQERGKQKRERENDDCVIDVVVRP